MTSLSEKIIKPKLGVLELAKQLGNVSQACKVMGYSRDTFYRYKELYEAGGGVRSIWLRHDLETFKKRLTRYLSIWPSTVGTKAN